MAICACAAGSWSGLNETDLLASSQIQTVVPVEEVDGTSAPFTRTSIGASTSGHRPSVYSRAARRRPGGADHT